jgi:hypothetical protein
MPMPRLATVSSALALMAVLGSIGPGVCRAQQANVTHRPATVNAVFTSSKTYDGEYVSAAVSRVCGETDPMYFGHHSYVFETPLDYGGESIIDVQFTSRDLVDGAKQTTNFHLSVGVKTAAGGQPPAYVVDTKRPGESGKATLNVDDDGTERVEIEARNTLGETVDLRFECGPPAAAK